MQIIHGLPALPESPASYSAQSCRLLHRIDPSRNMRRFYRLEILPDLFGGVILKREWGRIGSRGQSKARWFDDPRLASAALLRQAERKARRGYVAPEEEAIPPGPLADIKREGLAPFQNDLLSSGEKL